MLALATLSTRAVSTDEARGFEPGIFSLILRVMRAIVNGQAERSAALVNTFIEKNGGVLTDELERQITLGYVSGRF